MLIIAVWFEAKGENMSPYLHFEIGDSHNVRGRALCYTKSKEPSTTKTIQRLIDIDGTKLKEAMYNEILEGRLLVMDVFEPFFVATTPLDKTISLEELAVFAQKESRDLIPVEVASIEQEAIVEAIIEKTIARYITLYREDIYIRLTNQFANDIFRKRMCSKVHTTYIAIFKLACYTTLMIRAFRDGSKSEVLYHGKCMRELKKDIPVLDVARIAEILENGDGSQWYEMSNYVDVLFLTLKKHWPFPLEIDVHLTVKDEAISWLKEDIPALYEEFFLAIFKEDYEKAGMLKQAINTYHTSQSLEGCR